MTTVVIGEFDGMHVGHTRLVEEARVVADRVGGRLCAVVLNESHVDGWLLSVAERVALLEGAGCNTVLVVDPPLETPDLVDRIITSTRSERVVLACPPVFDAVAFHPLLRPGFARRGIEVIEIDRVRSTDGASVSSSVVRDALGVGDVRRAAELLGRPYTLAGQVVHGNKLGRTIGFPTANLDRPVMAAVPRHGVYAAHVTVPSGEKFAAAVNIGVRPTVADDQRVVIEAHLLEFDADIYGRTIHVGFERRLRDEERFDSLDALVAQLRRDVDAVVTGTGSQGER